MASLSDRLRKLERAERTRSRFHRRCFTIQVRKGHEEEDQATALAAIGEVVTDRDAVILLVITAPEGQTLDDVVPIATVSENNQRKLR